MKIFLLVQLCLFVLLAKGQLIYKIPQRDFFPYRVLCYDSSLQRVETKRDVDFKMTIPAFQVSALITWKEYKQYLEEVKKDSAAAFYIAQLPDSTITTTESYQQLISSSSFDDYPVPGISWLAALNYCKWRTLKENKSDSILFYYRLPKPSEWLCAYEYLQGSCKAHDFSKLFSDWTMGTYFDGMYGFKNDFPLDFIYLPVANQLNSKRKIVLGNSFLFQSPQLQYYLGLYFYDKGYRQTGFRLVTVPVHSDTATEKNLFNYWQLSAVQ
ncbi:MAG: SUMF1/EgtB/PvdO family nonheme iron enzyme [Bacteroidetes bacterium]|nr:SUMF1/EgtB/PvdO family nonheme iron enzyme [Bacteroidota bacterium]